MNDFRQYFKCLTGNDPFEWQEQLFLKFHHGEFPDACDIPTGLGKTSVMAIWLIALGLGSSEQERKIPLRLVYVVDRRVIVDQASEEAEGLLKKLTHAASEPIHPLHNFVKILQETSLLGKESLLALSTLRGQKADNREWFFDPSRPAIIIGTVDMIGSRLLFSGYGKVGINHRSLQAGLLGQDTFVVIDEAHLSPVFVSTLYEIREAVQYTALLRPFYLMSLSATLSGSGKVLKIDALKECKNSETARLRLHAKKHIEWLPFNQLTKAKTPDKGATPREIDEAFADCLVNRAIEHEVKEGSASVQSIVIFVQTVELVNRIVEMLTEKLLRMTESTISKNEKAEARKSIEDRILKITGEMRSAERDVLVKLDKFRVFLPERDRETPRPTHYLIATSCAEVGINLDADHGLCDLSTLDSMIQRIGRINRFGLTDAKITVLIDEFGLNAIGSDMQKVNEKKQILTKLAKDIKTLHLRIKNSNADKLLKKELQQKIRVKTKEKNAFEKKGTEFGFKNITREDKKVYFTWQALKSITREVDGVNASPLALRGLLTSNPNALPDIPVKPPLDNARVDDWAMTSLKQDEYPRPLVHYWLRGVIDDERAQTTLVWRAELDHINLTEETINEQIQQAVELVTIIPIQPQERANIATYRAEKLLKELTKKFPQKPFVIINSSNEANGFSGEQLKEERFLFSKLSFSTVILPCCVGGLDVDGNPLDKQPKELKTVIDVVGSEWTRIRIEYQAANKFSVWMLNNGSAVPQEFASLKEILIAYKGCGVCVNWKELKQTFITDDQRAISIAYLYKRLHLDDFIDENPDEVNSLEMAEVTVQEHNSAVGKYAHLLAGKIGLPKALSEAVAAAGFRHDLGKTREWWQKAIGNNEFEITPLAKSKGNMFDHGFNQGYRHEFGSLIDSLVDESLNIHPHRELILHLIAAHHGFARPHFPARAYDRNLPPPINQCIARETMLRFNRLQREYGWWQLAYLEAILKAADALASRDLNSGEI